MFEAQEAIFGGETLPKIAYCHAIVTCAWDFANQSVKIALAIVRIIFNSYPFTNEAFDQSSSLCYPFLSFICANTR